MTALAALTVVVVTTTPLKLNFRHPDLLVFAELHAAGCTQRSTFAVGIEQDACKASLALMMQVLTTAYTIHVEWSKFSTSPCDPI